MKYHTDGMVSVTVFRSIPCSVRCIVDAFMVGNRGLEVVLSISGKMPRSVIRAAYGCGKFGFMW